MNRFSARTRDEEGGSGRAATRATSRAASSLRSPLITLRSARTASAIARASSHRLLLAPPTRSQLSIPRAESRSISPRARLATFGRCVTPSGRPGSRMQRLAAATTRTAGRGAPALRSAPRSRPRRVLSEPARTSRLRRPFGGCVPLTTCGLRPRRARRGAEAPRRAYVFVAEAKHLISVVAEP